MKYVVAFGVLLIAGFASSTAFGRVLIGGSGTGATSTAADPAATTSDATSTDTTNGPDTTSTTAPASTETTTTTDPGTTTTTPEPPPGTSAPAFNPTLTTDKADYAPGSTVTLTGTGWGLGESIHLFVNDDMGQTWSLNADVLADVAGSFTYQFQLPNYFVSDYSVTAMGGAVGEVVKTAFTDAVNFQFLGEDGLQHTTSGSEEDLGTVTAGTALAATCPNGLTVKATGLGGGQSLGWAISYVSGYGSNGALSSPSSRTTISPSSGTFNGNGTQCITMSISTTGLSAGLYQGELQVARTSGASASTEFYFFRFTVAASTRATTTSLARTTGNSPSTFGDPLTFTATVTASGGDPSGVGTVTFKNGATTLCNAVPLSGNTATCSPSLAAGSYGITAEYGGTTGGSPQFQPSTSGAVAQTVNRANQIISVTTPAPASAAYNSSFAVAATGGGSGNPVTFSNAGSCSNSGATFTMTSGTGTCTVKYDQVGDANYNAASQVSEIVSATKANQTINVTTHAPASATYGSSFTVAATGGGSGNPVTFSSAGSCSNSGATFTMTGGSGTCTVMYDQAGNANYNAASQLSETVNATKASQTITFAALSNRTYGDPDFAVSASASSGLTVGLSVGATDNCTIAGSTVHITGAGSCTVTASQSGNADYADAPDVARSFTIAKSSQTISFDAPADHTYGDAPVTLDASASSGLPVELSADGPCTIIAGPKARIDGAGNCTITAAQPGNDNWRPATSISHTFAIDQAPLSITAEDKEITFPADRPAFTVGYDGFVNGDGPGDLGGTLSCDTSPDSTASSPNAGSFTINCSGQTSDNYAIAYHPGTLTVNRGEQTISFDAPADHSYGDAPVTLDASASSGLSVELSADGPCAIIAGPKARVDGAGNCTLTAAQPGNDNWKPAAPVSHGFSIAKKPLTITASSPDDIVYGDGKPAVTPLYDGFVNGDDADSLTTKPSCDTGYAAADDAGTYATFCSGAESHNYEISYQPGSYNVVKKALTITASTPEDITYGDGKPAVSASYDGFISGDDADSLTTEPTCGTDYTPGNNVGSYITTCSGADSDNYEISYQPGSFTVLKKALTITASSPADIIYGSPKPAIDPIYDGFISGDDSDKLTTKPTCGTAYSAGDNVGTYGTACAGAASGNYELSYLLGSFKVTKKSLTITASSPADIVYGSARPPVTATPSGLVTGDTLGDLNVSCTTPYSLGEAIGTYATSCAASGGKSGNYDITYVSGSFKVTKKSLTITASSPADIVYGSARPTVTAAADGLVAGNTLSDLNVACTSPYSAGDPIGTYATSCAAAGGKSGNYDIAYVAGSFNVDKKSLTITASSPADIVYGSSRPAVTPSANGLIAEDALSELNVSCTTPYSTGDPVGAYTTSCSASGGKSGNYNITYVKDSFNVTKKTLTITGSSPADITYGSAVPSVTPIYSGFISGQDANNLVSKPTCGTSYTPASPVGTYATTCSGAASGNYSFTYVAGSFKVFYGWSGFLQPINDTAHFVNLNMSIFKAGSTVPVKFQLTNAAGNPVQAGTLPQWVTPTVVGTTSAPVDETVYTDSPFTGSTYRWDGQQYIFNWQSPKNDVGKLYRIGVRLDDGKTYYVNIGLK